MRKGSTITKKPVVAYDTGEHIGKVEDLVLDLSKSHVQGLVVKAARHGQIGQLLSFHDIQAFGPDAVIVASHKAMIPATPTDQYQDELAHRVMKRRLTLMTADGYNLGVLIDVYFDEHTGMVTGYEVEGGLFADQSGGRSFVPAPTQLMVGTDVAFVPAGTADLMKEQDVRPHAEPRNTSVGANAPETGEVSGEPLREPTVDETRGRRVHRSVETIEGLVIAAQGQIVTDQVIARAKEYDLEPALIAAVTQVGSGVIGTGGERLKWARERLRDTTTVAVENAEKVWERVRGRVSDLHAGEHLKHARERLRDNTTAAVSESNKLWRRVREGVGDLHTTEHLKRAGERLRESTNSAVKGGGKLWERVRGGVGDLPLPGLRKGSKSTAGEQETKAESDQPPQ